jgi:hypothetical protein
MCSPCTLTLSPIKRPSMTIAMHAPKDQILPVAAYISGIPNALFIREAPTTYPRFFIRGLLLRAGLLTCRFARAMGAAYFCESLNRIEQTADEQLREDNWPVRLPGIGLTQNFAPDLAITAVNDSVRWVCIEDQDSMECHGLDAFIHRPAPLEIEVVTRATADPDAFAWDRPSSLHYSRVFPLRLDTTSWSCSDGGDRAELMFQLTLLSALFARAQGRTTVYDTLQGRYLPRAGLTPIRPGREVFVFPNFISNALHDLMLMLEGHPLRGCELEKVAARVISAWVANETFQVSDDDRLRGVDLALKCVGQEPAVLLRAAAVKAAFSSDEHAIAAVLAAYDNVMRSEDESPLEFQLAHLYAETSLGQSDRMTVGRLAAGFVLTLASQPDNCGRYEVEDFLDEVLNSALFLGRDQDVARIRLLTSELLRHAFPFTAAQMPAGQAITSVNESSSVTRDNASTKEAETEVSPPPSPATDPIRGDSASEQAPTSRAPSHSPRTPRKNAAKRSSEVAGVIKPERASANQGKASHKSRKKAA